MILPVMRLPEVSQRLNLLPLLVMQFVADVSILLIRLVCHIIITYSSLLACQLHQGKALCIQATLLPRMLQSLLHVTANRKWHSPHSLWSYLWTSKLACASKTVLDSNEFLQFTWSILVLQLYGNNNIRVCFLQYFEFDRLKTPYICTLLTYFLFWWTKKPYIKLIYI